MTQENTPLHAAIAEDLGVPRNQKLAPIVVAMYQEAMEIQQHYDQLSGPAAIFFKGTPQDKREITGEGFVGFVKALCRGMQYMFEKHGVAITNKKYTAEMKGDICHFWNPGGRDHDHIIISRNLILKYQRDKLAGKTDCGMIDTARDLTADEAITVAGVHEASHSRAFKNPELLAPFTFGASINVGAGVNEAVQAEYTQPRELLARQDVQQALTDLKLGAKYAGLDRGR